MNTREYDQTTTIAITIHNRDRLQKIKLVEEESWNNVLGRVLDTIDEATKRTVKKE